MEGQVKNWSVVGGPQHCTASTVAVAVAVAVAPHYRRLRFSAGRAVSAVLLRCLESEGQHQDTYRHRTAALRRCLTRAQPDNEGNDTRSGKLQTSHQLLIVSRIWKIFSISQRYFSIFDLSFKSFLWGEIISTKWKDIRTPTEKAPIESLLRSKWPLSTL